MQVQGVAVTMPMMRSLIQQLNAQMLAQMIEVVLRGAKQKVSNCVRVFALSTWHGSLQLACSLWAGSGKAHILNQPESLQ